jgi:hypothetical protein
MRQEVKSVFKIKEPSNDAVVVVDVDMVICGAGRQSEKTFMASSKPIIETTDGRVPHCQPKIPGEHQFRLSKSTEVRSRTRWIRYPQSASEKRVTTLAWM